MIKLIAAMAIGLAAFAAVALGTSAAEDPRVRIIHASPDAPAVDVYANGDQVLSDVPFKASSGYLSVPAGSYTFEVFAAGADAGTDEAVLTIEADLEADTDYTVVALNEVASLETAVFIDDNSAPAAGKAHVGVIHAGPDAPAVDVAVTGGPVLVSDLSFSEGAGPLPVDAGEYDLEVRVAGTETVALPLPGVQLDGGTIYTFVATGFLDGEPALTVVPFAESPAVEVAPPSAGSAGLLSSESNGGGYLPWIALAAAAGFVTLVAAKVMFARIRA